MLESTEVERLSQTRGLGDTTLIRILKVSRNNKVGMEAVRAFGAQRTEMNKGADSEDHGVNRELDMQDASGLLGSGSWKDPEGLCEQHQGGEGFGQEMEKFQVQCR